MAEAVGFVGMGTMGLPMAGHLLGSGKELVVWNRTPGKADSLAEMGARIAPSLADMARACNTIFLCVGRTEDVEEVLDGLAQGLAPGMLVVDHSTISPAGAEQFHQKLGDSGFRFIDAPVTGGSVGAQNGQLTIFCGGAEADIEEARPLMEHYAKRVERVGGPGAGQRAKLANQIAVGGALLALCESLAFARKAGLDVAQVRDLVAGGAGGSWAFDNYGPKIVAGDWTPGFSVKNQRKDFGYCVDAARAVGAAVPATRLADELLKVLDDEGRGELTTAALYEIYARLGFED